MPHFIPTGMGWIPDLPDVRDYGYTHPEILQPLLRLKASDDEPLPECVDLCVDSQGEYFTSRGDQGPLNSSTACAIVSLVEYFERYTVGHAFEASRLFLYKVTRNVREKSLGAQGDTGADLRTTLKVFAKFGVPPEEYWPYEIDRLHQEPSSFLYGLAQRFPGFRYFRLDESNHAGIPNWELIRSFLAAGFPIAFGFSVPTSLNESENIPFRPELDGVRGGQAALAVGYKLDHFGIGQHALRVLTSWGNQWGDNGKGYLPVAFIRRRLCRDFWTILGEAWIDSGELRKPSILRDHQ